MVNKLPMPFNNPRTYPGHSGVDYPQPQGTIIRASGPGRVRNLGQNARGGYYIWVDYDEPGIPPVGYHHMPSHAGCPAAGSRFALGSRLGYVGNTGYSTGPHLHSEVEGYASTDGYWKFFDRSRVVGGSTAGGTVSWTEAQKQTFLVSIGLDTGGIGNGWGPKSIAATKTFQGWVGLTVDGDFGEKTEGQAKAVIAGRNASTRPTRDVQTFLKGKGLLSGGVVDGEWGPRTSLGALRFQRSVSLVADAIWGPATDAKAFPPLPPEPTVPIGRNATSRPTVDVETFLKTAGYFGGIPDNVYDATTTAAVLKFQAAKFIEADGIWGMTSDGLAFPPAGSIHGVDYSFARPAPATLRDRGVKFAGRYLWPTEYNTKGITKEELAALQAAGIAVFFIYEEDGKELVSRDAGIRVAKRAEELLAAIDLEGFPVYFNVDYDAGADKLPGILAALEGIASVIGLERTGLYAGYGPIKAAFDAGAIRWGFQTYAWSGGRWDARAQLQQWSNGQWGGSVDFTRAMFAEFGQTPYVPPVEPEPIPDPDAYIVPLELGNQIRALVGEAFPAPTQ